MMRVGFIGWRGMVGSVLMQRMQEERDFDHIEPTFFTTSQAGGKGPAIGRDLPPLKDARDVQALASHDVLVSCQGAEYTGEIHPRLRGAGWKGYWIDAASALRMREDAVIILDPVNLPVIKAALARGARDYIGGNCTVSLMLMAMHGLLQEDLVEWTTAMTYQAASGAGAQNMRELVAQMGAVRQAAGGLLDDPSGSILDIDRAVAACLRSDELPHEHFGAALAGSLLPWIDKDLGNGQSREEWKAQAEGNKILGRERDPDPDGRCVRAHRSDALPQPGAHHQAQARCAACRRRDYSGRRQPVGESHPESARGLAARAHAGGGHRDAGGAHRAAAQAEHGRRVPGRLHGRRSAVVGRCRAAPAHAAHSAGG